MAIERDLTRRGAPPAEALLYRLDPRVKILAVVGFSVTTALLGDLDAIVLALVMATALIPLGRIALTRLLGRLLVVNLFIAMLWRCLPFTVPGEALLTCGPMAASREGLALALTLTLRSNAIVLALMTLAATTPVTSLVHGLSRLGLPDKLIYLFFFTYRYADEIVKEYHRIHNAMKIRAFRPRTSLHTYRSYAYLVGMLLVGSYERGERIHAAMVLRGFNGRFPHLDALSLRAYDAFALIATAGVITALVLING